MSGIGLSLRSPRLRLERIKAEDAAEYYEAGFETEDPEVAYYTGGGGTFDFKKIEAYVKRIAEAEDRYDFFIRLDDGEAIGEVVLKDLDPDTGRASMRIALFSSTRCGQGYGTEAVRRLLDFAFGELGLHRVELEVYSYNERARRSYLKCGFKEEGRLREAVIAEGRRHDIVLMGILRGEHEAARR